MTEVLNEQNIEQRNKVLDMSKTIISTRLKNECDIVTHQINDYSHSVDRVETQIERLRDKLKYSTLEDIIQIPSENIDASCGHCC